MSEQKINLWNIIDKFPQSDINHPNHNNGEGDTVMGIEEVYNAMKEAIRQALELAAENAKIAPFIIDEHVIYPDALIDKQSILDTIKQIE